MQADSLRSSIRDCSAKVRRLTKSVGHFLRPLWLRIRGEFRKKPIKSSAYSLGLLVACYVLYQRHFNPEREMLFTAFQLPAQMPVELQIAAPAISNRVADAVTEMSDSATGFLKSGMRQAAHPSKSRYDEYTSIGGSEVSMSTPLLTLDRPPEPYDIGVVVKGNKVNKDTIRFVWQFFRDEQTKVTGELTIDAEGLRLRGRSDDTNTRSVGPYPVSDDNLTKASRELSVQLLSADYPDVLGLYYMSHGENAKAIDAFQAWSRNFPQSPAPLFYLGMVQQDEGKREEAVESYESSLRLKLKDPIVLNNLGMLYGERGEVGRAEGLIRRFIKVKPAVFNGHNELGRILAKNGDHKAAIVEFEIAKKLAPNSPAVPCNYGASLEALGEYKEAIAEFNRGLQIEVNPCTLNNLGNTYLDMDHQDEAIPVFLRALAITPTFVPSIVNLGSAYLQQGQFAKAKEQFFKALSLQADCVIALSQLGVTMLQNPIEEKLGVEYLKKALAIDPNEFNALVNLGAGLHGLNRNDEAEGYLRHAVALRPDDPRALTNLGIVLTAEGDLYHASGYLEKAFQGDANPDPNLLVAIGDFYKSKGNPDLAIHWYREAIAKAPKFAVAHFQLGIVLFNVGDRAVAEQEFREARRLNPRLVEPPTVKNPAFNQPN